ncbi:MAG: MMPL family transporter [Gammaproteobacteria bacterium]|nr:MMPL family transporter [Gammaproteobacteria bacterium]
MDNFLLGLSEFFERLPNRVLGARNFVLTGVVVISILMIWGIFTRTEMDLSADAYLDETDPAIQALDEYRRQFGSDDSVLLVYRALDGDVFSRESLSAVQQLTDDLRNWQDLDPADFPVEISNVPVDFNELNHIRRVQSVANVRFQRNEGDTLLSLRLVPAELPESDVELAQIKAGALAQEDLVGMMYSANAEYGMIMIQTDFGMQPVADYVPAVDAPDISLDASFDFSGDGFLELDFDEEAEITEVDFEPVDVFSYSAFHVATTAIWQQYEDRLEYYPVGAPPTMAFMLDTINQLYLLGILMVLIFIMLLWILFRSFSAVLWPILTIALSVAWTWGVTVWLGIEVSTFISLTVLLIFAVGIADCVHVMNAYFSYRREGEEHYRAISRSFGRTGLALLVTTLTTSAGVLALTTSELLPMQVFGFMSAAGVVLAFLFTVILLPILLDIWHPGFPGHEKLSIPDRLARVWNGIKRNRKIALIAIYAVLLYAGLGFGVGSYILFISFLTYAVVNWHQQILQVVPYIVARRPWQIVIVFAGIFGICVYGATRVEIDTNISELVKEDHPLRQAYEVVDANMAGSQSMVIVIDTNVDEGMLDPRILQAVDDLEGRILESQAEHLTRTYSLVNIVKDTNEVMNDGDPDFYRVPETRQMVSQLLYLFNSANPEDRRALVSDDYSKAQVTLNIRNSSTNEYQGFFDNIGDEIEASFAHLRNDFPEMEINLTGSMALLWRMSDEISRSQVESFAIALAVISVMLIVTLGSLQGGLIAMVPNLIPAFLGFGLMGLAGIPLDADTLLVAPVIIGIAVDDTIHFMTHYRVQLIKTGSISESLRLTISHVGQAVMFTTMVLGLGFMLLSFSDYLGMARMGFFGSLAIIMALACDLFLIPALIMIFKPTFGVKNADRRITFLESPA